MKETLYELTADYQRALDEFSEDMDDAAVIDTLNAMKDTIQIKATNVAKFIGNQDALVEAMKRAEKNMAARRKVIENKINKMKDYIHSNMEFSGIHSIETPEFTIKIKKNPPKLVIGEKELIPKEYINEKVTNVIDNAKIKSDLKNGKEVQGAKLEQTTRLEIK